MAAVYHIKILIDLEQTGVSITAVVVDIERGARNSSWAVYNFNTEDGQEVTARDAFQQYVIRVEKWESLYVIYDRNNIETVTADLGIWTWQAPLIFFCGFFFLVILAYLIWRHTKT